MKKVLFLGFGVLLCLTLGFFAKDIWLYLTNQPELISPFVSNQSKEKPLQALSIPDLKTSQFGHSKIVLEKELLEEEDFTSYLFSYTTLNKKMTGQLNMPKELLLNEEDKPKVIILLRGYVPLSIYQTGVGTKNAAKMFAEAGYITIAPDFFGYGESDPEPEDTWQARFEKPKTVIELINTIETTGVPTNGRLGNSDIGQTQKQETREQENSYTAEAANPINQVSSENLLPPAYSLIPTDTIGLWAHSNGGQIALTTLEILSEPIPTTLWAPVTAPFPYSILFFSDEEGDEGKASRKYVSLFEETYDVFDFSLTQHLDWLSAPLQLHHGTNDEAAPIVWSDEFVQKIAAENKRRLEIRERITAYEATASGDSDNLLQVQWMSTEQHEEIELDYYRYPGADHNLQPGWDLVIERDLEFFAKHL